MDCDPNGYPVDIVVPDLSRVFQAIRDQNCIPFFGAGASMGYAFNGSSATGIAGGWEITLSLLQQANVASPAQIAALKNPDAADPAALREAMKLQGYDLFKAADRFLYSRNNDRMQLEQFLKQEVNKATMPRPIHSVIAQLKDVFTVLTTNYDCLFETACETYGREIFKHVHEQFKADSGNWRCKSNLKENQILIHKMHGSKECAKSMIITRDDYIRYLANWKDPAKGMPQCVSSRLPGSTLLFLGYGLADWNLLTIWEGVVRSFAQGGNEVRSFAVMNRVSPEDEQYFRDKNIEVLKCDLTHFALAIAREFKLEVPQLGLPKQAPANGGPS